MSDIDDLAEHAAGLLCAVGIYHNDQTALDFIMSHQFHEKQQGQICLQAGSSFNLDEYHKKSRMVLTYLITGELQGFSHLFFDRCIVIPRDEEVLIHPMESAQNVHLFHSLLDYLYESNEDICSFARVLNAIGSSFSRMTPEIGERLSDMIDNLE